MSGTLPSRYFGGEESASRVIHMENEMIGFCPVDMSEWAKVTEFHMKCCTIIVSPETRFPSNLTTLELYGCILRTIPSGVGSLKQLEELNLRENVLQGLPTEIGGLTRLKRLFLSWNELDSIPTEIGRLSQLEHLCLYDNRCTGLPSEFGNLQNLQKCNLGRNPIAQLPTEIGNLCSLTHLWLIYTGLTTFPRQIGRCFRLKVVATDHVQGDHMIPWDVFAWIVETRWVLREQWLFYWYSMNRGRAALSGRECVLGSSGNSWIAARSLGLPWPIMIDVLGRLGAS